MNKWFRYIFIATIFMFIAYGGVNAEADLVCTFKLNSNNNLICNVTASNQSISCNIENPGYLQVGDKNNLQLNDFLSNNEYKCPSEIYYSASAGQNKAVFNNFSRRESSTSNIKAELSDEKVNKKTSDDINENIYCKYGNLTLTINPTNKTITASNSSCGSIKLNDITYEAYEKSIKNSDLCFKKVYKARTNQVCQYYLSDHTTSALVTDEIKYNYSEPAIDADGNKSSETSKKNNQKHTRTSTSYSCEDMSNTMALLKQVYTLIRYLIPILIIGLSIVDFVKVVANGEDKVFKEVWNKFIKRLIIGVVILIIPMILQFLIHISGIAGMYDLNENNIFCIFS